MRDRYGAQAGFITMNLPLLLDALDRVGVENPIICANINKIANQAEAGGAVAPAAEPGRSRRVILGAPPEGP